MIIKMYHIHALTTIADTTVYLILVRGRGLEPPRPYGLIHLKDKCLPISTPAREFLRNKVTIKIQRPAEA